MNVFGTYEMRVSGQYTVERPEADAVNCFRLDRIVVEISSLPAQARVSVHVRTVAPQERKLRCRALLLLLLASSRRVADMTDGYNVHRTQTASRSVSTHHSPPTPRSKDENEEDAASPREQNESRIHPRVRASIVVVFEVRLPRLVWSMRIVRGLL